MILADAPHLSVVVDECSHHVVGVGGHDAVDADLSDDGHALGIVLGGPVGLLALDGKRDVERRVEGVVFDTGALVYRSPRTDRSEVSSDGVA